MHLIVIDVHVHVNVFSLLSFSSLRLLKERNLFGIIATNGRSSLLVFQACVFCNYFLLKLPRVANFFQIPFRNARETFLEDFVETAIIDVLHITHQDAVEHSRKRPSQSRGGVLNICFGFVGPIEGILLGHSFLKDLVQVPRRVPAAVMLIYFAENSQHGRRSMWVALVHHDEDTGQEAYGELRCWGTQ